MLLAKAEILIPAAAPFGLILIAALFWLAARPQRVGWGLFTLWLEHHLPDAGRYRDRC